MNWLATTYVEEHCHHSSSHNLRHSVLLVDSAQVETLPDFLKNITLKERKYLLSNVEKVRPFFQYLDPKEEFRIDNAASLLLFELWERKGSVV